MDRIKTDEERRAALAPLDVDRPDEDETDQAAPLCPDCFPVLVCTCRPAAVAA